MKKLKENDVFKWKYTREHIDSLKYKNDLYHCKEGLAIVKELNGELVFFDTFWGIGRTDNYSFKIKEVGEKYDVEYYCNLDELEKKERYAQIEKYYDDKDIFILHDQHACVQSCIYHYLRKGAKKSKEKIEKVLNRKIESLKSDIEWKQGQLEQTKEKLKKVESGNIDIYI